MSIVIIVAIIIAAFGFFAIFNLGGADDKPKQSDVFATNAFLLAIGHSNKNILKGK